MNLQTITLGLTAVVIIGAAFWHIGRGVLEGIRQHRRNSKH